MMSARRDVNPSAAPRVQDAESEAVRKDHDAPLVNLGCGGTYHPDWLNFDFDPASSDVRRADLRKGIPLPDASCAAVYHSHILEHFSESGARRFLRECHRVLRPGGVIRVAVPDLERIARNYLAEMEAALAGGPARHYDWAVIELLDQLTRKVGGGTMLRVLKNTQGADRDFIRARFGAQADQMWAQIERARERKSLLCRLRRAGVRRLMFKIKTTALGFLIRLVGGRRLAAGWKETLFRETGEVHRWMYDRYSLARLLTECGFTGAQQTSALESMIPRFPSYQLDTVDGKVRKADSLFMEARKPS